MSTPSTTAHLPTKWIDRNSRQRVDIIQKPFGFRDTRGREVGIFATIDTFSIALVTAEESRWSSPVPLFEAAVVGALVCRVFAQVTRDGTTYGAASKYHYFETLEEARKWLEARFKRSERENRRKFAQI